MSPIRVVHIIDSLRGGGAEKLLEVTLPHMHRAGIHPAVIYLNDETACAEGLLAAGIPMLCLRPGCSDGYRGIMRTPQERRRDQETCTEFCRKHGAQLLHAHLVGSYLLVGGLAKALDLPYVVTDHCVDDVWQVDHSFKGRLVRRLVTGAYRNAGKVVCVSGECRWYLEQKMGMNRIPMTVLENTISDQFWTALPPDGSARAYDAIMCGRLGDQKNHLYALEVFRRVAEGRPGFRAAIVGEGQNRALIESRIESLGLSESVSMLGRKKTDEVVALLDSSRVFFMPSLQEGLPLAGVEALARGLPALFSDLPVFHSTFDGVPHVDFVDLGNPQDAADKMVAMLQSWSLVPRPQLKERFSMEGHLAAMRGIYESTVGI